MEVQVAYGRKVERNQETRRSVEMGRTLNQGSVQSGSFENFL